VFFWLTLSRRHRVTSRGNPFLHNDREFSFFFSLKTFFLTFPLGFLTRFSQNSTYARFANKLWLMLHWRLCVMKETKLALRMQDRSGRLECFLRMMWENEKIERWRFSADGCSAERAHKQFETHTNGRFSRASRPFSVILSTFWGFYVQMVAFAD
jgi:hypothetical protein